MYFLNSASGASVGRGFDYYVSDQVISIKQLNRNEYEGYVKGSYQAPYHVTIHLESPLDSHCDCPHANGFTICKHMIALYFMAFPDEAEDYQQWYEHDDESFNEFDDYYDRDEEDEYQTEYEEALFFDTVLHKFLHELSIEEVRALSKDELYANEKTASNLSSKEDAIKFFTQHDITYQFLNHIIKQIKEVAMIREYNICDFNLPLFCDSELNQIQSLYQNATLRRLFNKVLFIPELAIYRDFTKLIDLYQQYQSIKEIQEFCTLLECQFHKLKHYSIKNLRSKSNILITIYMLSNFSTEKSANSLLQNAKYSDYVDYVISHSTEYAELYNTFLQLIEQAPSKNKRYIPDVLYAFIRFNDCEDMQQFYYYYLYDYLICGEDSCLCFLEEQSTQQVIIATIEGKTNDTMLLATLYKHFDLHEKLWALLYTDVNKSMLLQYFEPLKQHYPKALYDYFKEQFYSTIKLSQGREAYQKASVYMKAISQLEHGDELTASIIKDLRNSKFKNYRMLFNEISIAVKSS